MWKNCALFLMILIGYVAILSAGQKVQLVLTVPRTVSTAFERAMMARNDHKVFHEPFTVSWMFRTGNASHMEGDPPHEILDAKKYEDVKTLIYGYAETDPVFLKDMVHSCGEDILLDDALLSDPNVIITILIRDPARCMESFFNKGLKNISMLFMPYVIKMGYRFDLLMQIAEKHHTLRGTWPIIVEAEELCQHPEDTMQAFCARAGIAFVPEALRWEQGMPMEWKQTASWHDDAAQSCGFYIPNRDSQDQRFASIPPEYVSSLEEIYQKQKPFYEQLRAVKAKAAEEEKLCTLTE